MKIMRALLTAFSVISVVLACMLHALDVGRETALLPVAIVGVVYGLLNAAKLLFVAAVIVKLKAHVHEQHKRREAIRSQRLRKARR